jgi:hypothetical protein
VTDLTSEQKIRVENLQKEVQNFLNTKIVRLRKINHGWNIGLAAAGITCTLLTTVLGVVDGNQLQGLIKVGTGLFGATAVAAQSTANQFRLKGKAGKYTVIEAKGIVIAHKLHNVRDEVSLQDLEDQFYELIQEAAETEAQDITEK